MRVLALLNRVPFPLNDGGAIATYRFIEALSEAGASVDILCYNTRKHYAEDSVLARICENYRAIPLDTTITPAGAFKNLWSDLPYSIERFVSSEFRTALSEELRKREYDLVHIDHTYMAWCIEEISQIAPTTPIVVRLHNVEYIIAERLSEGKGNFFKRAYYKLLAKRTKRFEKRWYSRAEALLPLTEADRERVVSLGCNVPMKALSAGVNISEFYPGEAEFPYSIMLFGSWDWEPNVEGLRYFCSSIYSLLQTWERVPAVHLGGKNPSEEVQVLARRYGFELHANVPSAADFLRKYGVLAVPLLSGGGMRIKIIEALACGKTIVSTRVGAEGIPLEDGKHCLLADSPQDFAKSLHLALCFSEKSREIGRNAEHFARQYSWRCIGSEALGYYETIAKKKTPR